MNDAKDNPNPTNESANKPKPALLPFAAIFRENCLKNGLLPIFLPGPVCNRLMAEILELPGSRIAVDLASQTVYGPDGSEHHFEIDPFAKECLLKGLDEIAYTLTLADEISAFEQRYEQENV